jgi:signal transduction histidine kinase
MMDKDLYSFISHELRNPLAGTKLLTEMLLNGSTGELSETQRKMIEDIESSNEKMIEIIAGLSDKVTQSDS